MFRPKKVQNIFDMFDADNEEHVKWKHFKALLLMELNVRSIENNYSVKLGENQCMDTWNFNFQLKNVKGKP